ncbi:MAG: TM0106 family RecB-like putative nuclease, partial [Acidobacteria bacterium]|nr:TM0106 family RecB-like putative nuclease [Acidobacteriota bacterium]
MHLLNGEIRLAATDVSNHLTCRHLTELELSAAHGERDVPKWESPDMAVIRELGLRHETKYLKLLAEQVGPDNLINLSGMDEKRILDETRRAMEAGIEVIAQGALLHRRWFGRPDVLRKIKGKPSRFGDWSYEAYDCKLSKETKATTILQLSFYSELLGEIQRPPNTPSPALDPKSKSRSSKAQTAFDFDAVQVVAVDYLPEFMWVVPPGKETSPEQYRVAEYAAYYRHVKERLERATNNGHGITTYPEPCLHCDICRWFRECEKRRRDDDHLSLVAGIRRQHRDQLEVWEVTTVEKLAAMQHPLPREKKPLHGSRESYDRVREQARVQVAGRTQEKLIHEPILPIVEKTGFCKLPEPSEGDVFVDLEGDPFVGEIGLQYLFGVAVKSADGQLRYEKRWAENPAEEKSAFEWFVDLVTARRKEFPAIHVYHFGGYEPGAFKRLMGLYATREEEIDSMLRAGLFVDLHSVFKQALRAGVEEYSLKKLEHFCDFKRTVPPDESRAAMRYIEHRLELAWDEPVPEKFITAMEGYNRDDCFATSALRDWLESERAKRIAAGDKIDRPPLGDGAPTEELDARQKRVQDLVEKLTAKSLDPLLEADEQKAIWLLAQLLDFHRRESKAGYWEGFRLADLDDDALLDDRSGLAGLEFLQRFEGDGKKTPIDRYHFAKQETDARIEKELWFGRDREKFGTVTAIDFASRTIDVKKTKKSTDVHPPAVYVWKKPYGHDDHADALLRLGDQTLEIGLSGLGNCRAVRDLLLRRAPRLLGGETLVPLPLEEPKITASRIAGALNHSVFPIQGPPGVGKTTTGAHMICDLIRQGKKIGVTAQSHQVIQNLLSKVVDTAKLNGFGEVRCLQKLASRDDL